jgi:hypothetical protein
LVKRVIPVIPVVAGLAAGAAAVGATTAYMNRGDVGEVEVAPGWQDTVSGAMGGQPNQQQPLADVDGLGSSPAGRQPQAVTPGDLKSGDWPTLNSNDWSIFAPGPSTTPIDAAFLYYQYRSGIKSGQSVLLPGTIPGNYLFLDPSRWSSWLKDTYNTEDKVLGLKAKLFNAGYLKNPDSLRRQGFDMDGVDAAYAAFLDLSSKNLSVARAGSRSLLNIEDYLNTAEGKQQAEIRSRLYLPTPAESEASLLSYYQEYVGRAPSRREVEAFTQAVMAEARKRPEVTTITPGKFMESGEMSPTSEVTTGGFDKKDLPLMARREAMADPESGPYRMASKYFDAFLDVIGTPQGMGTKTDISQLLT